MNRLAKSEWQTRRAAHRERVRPWTTDRVLRSQYGRKHPVRDFLFEYYSYRPAHLERWSPGLGTTCDGAPPGDWEHESTVDDGWQIDAGSFPVKWRPHLDGGREFLRAMLDREPQFACFGLHEWAMVYKADAVRHAQFPLRLSRAETDAVVESQSLRCTHFDAWRFFTPEATPRNRIALSRATQIDHDQPGCIHATMDLYKLAFRLGPFVAAELIGDCFELACDAREIDMRASPYDLESLGYPPIRIETKEGRDEYAREQRRLAGLARPLRDRLLAAYDSVATAVAH